MTAIDVVVGRQAIFDRNRALYGYELLFRPIEAATDPAQVIDGDLMTSTVLFSAVGIGLDRLISDRFVFCNADRGLLTGAIPVCLPPEQTVIEVLETVQPDEAVLQGCQRLSEQGFRLALDDFLWFDGVEPLLEIADIVKIDVRLTPITELPELIRRLRSYEVELLAEKVETEEEVRACQELDFDYFQGYALARPKVVPGRTLGPSKLGRLRLASALLANDFEIRELEKIISMEPGLTYQLLQMAGAGGMGGTRRRLRNVREALVMAGSRRIQSWLALLNMVELGSTSVEDLTCALTRAKMSELLAAEIEPREAALAFTAGMVSAVDVLLGMPVAELLDLMSLGEDLHEAAFGNSSPMGRLVRDVVDHLNGRTNLPRRSPLSDQDFDLAAIRALTWALDVVDDLSGSRQLVS